jgi:acetylornithine deacetylase/succinyl-diaminopimelate desuccinylase-like protein
MKWWLAIAIGFAIPSWGQEKRGLDYIEKAHARTIEKQILISEIPAPTFEEQKRAAYLASEFRRLGLKDVEIDPRVNVLGLRPGRSSKALMISAHLDTVFPAGTDVKVKKQGSRLNGPGIADDGRGLAALLTLLEALNEAKIETNHTLLFAANCCEEGLGDLLGMKYLLREGKYKDRIAAVIAIDGTDPTRIVNGALASKRYRITVRGPGGHSYGNFGRANPAHAIGRIIAHFADVEVPEKPRTTYNVGKMGGGTSINSIPFENWIEVDMRSESDKELEKLELALLEAVRRGAEEENRARAKSGTRVEADAKLLATRYSGFTPENSPLVESARSAILKITGQQPRMQISSTDANVPINMGIPAVTMGGGGRSGDAHSLLEWFDPEGAWKGPQVLFLTLLGFDANAK